MPKCLAESEVAVSELGGFICRDLVARGEKNKEDHSSSTHPAEASLLLSAWPGTLACKPVLTPKIWAFVFCDAHSKVKYFLNSVSMTSA